MKEEVPRNTNFWKDVGFSLGFQIYNNVYFATLNSGCLPGLLHRDKCYSKLIHNLVKSSKKNHKYDQIFYNSIDKYTK